MRNTVSKILSYLIVQCMFIYNQIILLGKKYTVSISITPPKTVLGFDILKKLTSLCNMKVRVICSSFDTEFHCFLLNFTFT